jgi:hypothetical protein
MDIVATLVERYGDRIQEKSPIGILMAGKEKLIYGNATLYYIHGTGYSESVDFICTGHGGPYAMTLAKFLFHRGLCRKEAARRIAFVTSWVAEDVDVTVGGEPDVVIVYDGERSPERLDSNSILPSPCDIRVLFQSPRFRDHDSAGRIARARHARNRASRRAVRRAATRDACARDVAANTAASTRQLW